MYHTALLPGTLRRPLVLRGIGAESFLKKSWLEPLQNSSPELGLPPQQTDSICLILLFSKLGPCIWWPFVNYSRLGTSGQQKNSFLSSSSGDDSLLPERSRRSDGNGLVLIGVGSVSEWSFSWSLNSSTGLLGSTSS